MLDNAKNKKFVEKLLQDMGEDPSREGLRSTPGRFLRSLEYFRSGYDLDPVSIGRQALFNSKSRDLVVIKDINFFSLCEHHLLPFYGQCHIGYLPAGKIIGLSKVGRVVDALSRRLQMQERLTLDIAGALTKVLRCRGLGIKMEAHHLCMMMRGVEKNSSKTVTSTFNGALATASGRQEFFSCLGH